jgi:excisionase family DNA binding protein
MDNLSWRFSQEIEEIFQHTENAPLTTHALLVHNRRVKLNTHFGFHRKRTACQSHEFGRSKVSSTEFFGTAAEICERRWSGACAYPERQQMLLTIEEVARDHLKVSRATVYRLIRAGELKSAKVLGCTRISSQELERFEKMIGGVR